MMLIKEYTQFALLSINHTVSSIYIEQNIFANETQEIFDRSQSANKWS